MNKWFFAVVILASLGTMACHKNKTDRYDPNQTYERFINSHVFAACAAYTKPYATYSLAKLLRHPGNDNNLYKVQFINGECKGLTVWTPYVITKTQAVDNAALLPTGTVVIRNFDNPPQQDKDITDHWNLGVVMGTQRANKGIIDLGFPRDANDFFPARESVHVHNVRLVVKPQSKDIRHFIK